MPLPAAHLVVLVLVGWIDPVDADHVVTRRLDVPHDLTTLPLGSRDRVLDSPVLARPTRDTLHPQSVGREDHRLARRIKLKQHLVVRLPLSRDGQDHLEPVVRPCRSEAVSTGCSFATIRVEDGFRFGKGRGDVLAGGPDVEGDVG